MRTLLVFLAFLVTGPNLQAQEGNLEEGVRYRLRAQPIAGSPLLFEGDSKVCEEALQALGEFGLMVDAGPRVTIGLIVRREHPQWSHLVQVFCADRDRRGFFQRTSPMFNPENPWLLLVRHRIRLSSGTSENSTPPP